MNNCVTIRSVLVNEDRAYVQVGAGIVADSEPEKEYEETLNRSSYVIKKLTY